MFRLLRKKEETLTLHTETFLTYEKDTKDGSYISLSKYKSSHRRLKRAHLEDTQNRTMSANGQTTIPGQKAPRYTGFNEPFSHDRNTTLPHPDADTSPNATIEGLDFNLTRTHSKSSFRHAKSHASHSFRHPLNRSKNSAGATSIGSDLSSLYDNIQYADGSVETRGNKEIEKEVETREDVVRMPKSTPGLIPGVLGGQKKRERLPNDSGVDMAMDVAERQSSEEYSTEKKKGLLGKLGL